MRENRDSWKASLRVLRKEILETRRDRSLVMQLVLVPLLIYPLLGFMGIQIMIVAEGAAEKIQTVVVVDQDLPENLRAAVEDIDGVQFVAAPEGTDHSERAIDDVEFRALREEWSASERAPSVWISWFGAAETDSLHILYDSSRDRSSNARENISIAVRDLQNALMMERAAAVGLSEVDLELWVFEDTDASTAEKRGRWILSMILPMLLMFMLPQGAFYAVLDTVVGERERGTWETILTSPLSRTEILRGKLFYVIVWSLVAFTLNLIGMFLFIRFAAAMLLPDAGLDFQLTSLELIVAFMAVVLLALALAAVMMMLASTARNYREGQAVLTPVYLVAAFSGMFALLTGEEFTVTLAAIPVVNVTALLRAAFQGEVPFPQTIITFAEMGLISLVCLIAAGKLVNNEAVLFDPSIDMRKLWNLMRRNDR